MLATFVSGLCVGGENAVHLWTYVHCLLGVLSDDTLEAGGSTDIYFDCRRVGLSVRLQPHLTMSARTAYEMNGLW
jgi:hypothetical protein